MTLDQPVKQFVTLAVGISSFFVAAIACSHGSQARNQRVLDSNDRLSDSSSGMSIESIAAQQEKLRAKRALSGVVDRSRDVKRAMAKAPPAKGIEGQRITESQEKKFLRKKSMDDRQRENSRASDTVAGITRAEVGLIARQSNTGSSRPNTTKKNIDGQTASKKTPRPRSNRPSQHGGKVQVDEIRTLQKALQRHAHLEVTFDQLRYSSIRKRERKTKGRARFTKPDKFRWRIESPENEWIYNGKSLYNYSPDVKSAVEYKLSGPRARSVTNIVDLVLNFNSLLKKYDVVKATRVGDLVKVELVPKGRADVKAVDLQVSTSKNYISYIKMYFANGNHTVLDFKTPVRRKIANSVYSLPKGVRVTTSN